RGSETGGFGGQYADGAGAARAAAWRHRGCVMACPAVQILPPLRAPGLTEMGPESPRLESGYEWPFRLAAFMPNGQNNNLWTSRRSKCARPSNTSSSPLLNRSERWSLSCDAAVNSIMLACKNAATPGSSVG